MTDWRTCPECGVELREGLCPRCLIAAALGESVGEQPRPAPAASSSPKLGDYELLESIGGGGMGVVYRARHLRLGRMVAIKTLPFGGFSRESYVRRFHAEASAAARLRHPNIVAIHEVGEHAGQPWFAMDLIEGSSLAELIREQPVPITRAVRFVRTIAEAVHYAHTQSILHRDLKPSNVLVDRLDQPHITDFGLAKDLRSDSELTLSGQTLGSPNYMPPEQCGALSPTSTTSTRAIAQLSVDENEAAPVPRLTLAGPASDVYGLGAIFYHLLTGRPPFQGETVADVLSQLRERDPIPPRLLNPSVPRDLETIGLKCLEKDPVRRYSTALELAEELGRWQTGEPIRARAITPPERAWRWCRRRPQLAGTLVALLVALVLGVAGIAWQGRKATQEAARASTQSAEAQRNLYAANMGLAFRALDEGNRGQTVMKLMAHWPRPGQEDLRGWEWRYLWDQSRGDETATLGLHSNSVMVTRFFPDGRTLAAITTDGVLELWDLPTRSLKKTTHSWNRLDALSLSPDGLEIAVSGEDGGIEILDALTLERRSRIETGRGVDALVHSPDGRYLAWAETGAGVVLYDRAGNRELTRFHTLGSPRWAWKSALAFSCDSRYLALGIVAYPGLQENHVAIWDCQSQKEVRRLPCANMGILSVTFSPDDHQISATINGGWTGRGGQGGRVIVWNWRSGVEVTNLLLDPVWIGSAAYSPDGKWLAAASRGQTILMLDTSDWRTVATLQGHHFEVFWVEFTPDGRLLASGSKDRTIKLWDPRLRPRRQSFRDLTSMGGTSVSLSQDGRRLLVRGRDGTFRWINPTTLESGQPWTAPDPQWTTVSTSADGSLVAFGCTNGVVRLADSADGATLGELTGAPALVSCVSFSSTGKRLVALKRGGFVDVWDLFSKRILQNLKSQRLWATSAAFSPDDNLLVVGADRGFIEVWDLVQGIHREIRTGHSDHVPELKFSPDGGRLATTGYDGTIRLWSTSDWHLEAVLSGQLTSFGQMAFTPDGQRLAAAGEGSIRVWNVGQMPPLEVGILSSRTGTGAHLAFHSDGETLVSAEGSALHVWRAPPLQEIDPSVSPSP